MNINNNSSSGIGSSDSNSNHHQVAVIGIGFRIPGCGSDNNSNDPDSLYINLKNKFNGVIKTSDRWSNNYYINNEIQSNKAALLSLDEIKSFDPLFFGISPSDCSNIDPQQRLLLKCVWESFEDAHIDPIKLRGSNTSVFIGTTTLDYQINLRNQEETLSNIFGTTSNSISNRISYCFNFKGCSLSVDTACSSSSQAINMGYNTIVNGESDYSVVGGTSLILDPTINKAFTHLKILGKSGYCKSFDADADGYVRGEGIGIVILKNLNKAIQDGDKIYCVINGVNSNNDGNDMGKSNFYSPSATGQFDNLKSLFNKHPHLSPSDIDYCELHATGTPTGDPIECEGISMAFSKYHSSDNPLLIGSFKSNIGHSEGCSGIASLIKCCLMYKYRQFLPTIHFNKPNPAIKFDEWNLKVVTEVIPFPTNKKVSMIVNNFGITGSNVVLALSEYNSTDYSSNNNGGTDNDISNSNNNNNKSYLIPISANSKQSLNNYINKIQNNSNNNKINFNDILQNQINSKTTQLYQRSVILAKDINDIISGKDNTISTNNLITSNITLSNDSSSTTNICFVFSGQGTQYNSMGVQLYNENQLFRDTINELDSKLSKYFGYSIYEKFTTLSKDDEYINHPIIAQPSICLIQCALFKLLTQEWNVKPNYIIGHSLGEFTAQYCSGAIDIDTFCYILYHRSCIQEKTVGLGRMLAVNISYLQYIEDYSSEYPSLEVACFNSPSSIVIAGNENELNQLDIQLKSNNIFTSLLPNPSSFHTSSQVMSKEEFLNLEFTSSVPQIPTLSILNQDFFNNSSIKYNSEYLYNSLREPVFFYQTVEKLYSHIADNKLGNKLIFIEIGPHTALSYHLKQTQPPSLEYITNTTILSTLNKNKSDINQIFQLIGHLYCNHHININFKNQLINNNNNNHQSTTSTSTTTRSYKYKDYIKYQWDDKLYWKEDKLTAYNKSNGSPIELLGNKNITSPFISFKTIIDIEKPVFKYLKGHQINSKYYLPGSCYIENIISAFPSNDLIISYLEFKLPVINIEGIGNHIQTNIYQTSKKEYKAMFHHYLASSELWVLVSSGNFQLYEFNNANEKIMNIDQIKSDHCNLTTLSSTEFYNHVKNNNSTTYTGAFQLIKTCYLGKDCLLTQLSPSNNNEDNGSSTESIINSATLDCCVHSFLLLIEENSQIVFDSVEDFKFYSSNVPFFNDSGYYVYVRLKRKSGNSYYFSTTVMLEDGTIIIDMGTCKATSMVDLNDRSDIQYPNISGSNNLYTTYLEPALEVKKEENTIQSTTSQLNNNNNNNNDSTISQLNITLMSYLQNNINNNNNNNTSLNNNEQQNINSFIFIDDDDSNNSFNNINNFKTINSIDQLLNQINNSSVIYYLKTTNQLNNNNYQSITLEYIQIIQHLIKNQLNNTKLILVSKNCHSEISSNYLAASVIGSFKYFLDQHPDLNLYSFDYDDESFSFDFNQINNTISKYTTPNHYVEREFIIRNNIVKVEKIKLESNIYNNYKTKSFIKSPSNNSSSSSSNKDQHQLSSYLNSNLEFEYQSKKKLLEHQVEVKVEAIGINYKDFLIYSGNVQAQPDEETTDINHKFGLEYCGKIESIGTSVNKFKVGDYVYGIKVGSSSTSVITHQDNLTLKPDNLTSVQAASIPVVYVTSYYSLYDIGSLKEDQTVLIHSGTGGVGLSALEILKWKGHKGHIFTTVGSDDKANYLRDTYGSFITGIYSTRDKDYVENIKSKLKELNSEDEAVDLIINTLPNEYNESNFKCLNQSGRIVDLTITQLNPHEYIDFSKFKYNYGYNNVNLTTLKLKRLSRVLSKISEGISSGQLSLIPIKEYTLSNIKDAIEYINERKHIGKIVVNYSNDNTSSSNGDSGHSSSSCSNDGGGHSSSNDNDNANDLIKISNYSIDNELGETLLFTGQTGIVLEIIKWITRYSNNVKNIIILSKSSLKWELEYLIKLNQHKINYYFKSVDIENINQVEESLNQLSKDNNITNINSIFHFATHFNFIESLDINKNNIKDYYDPKIQGAINLHQLSIKYKWNVYNFMVASSICGIFSDMKQCPYVAACCTIDSFINYRKSIGLPGLSINIGNVQDVGYVSRNISIGEHFKGKGFDFISIKLLLGSLDLFIQNQDTIQNNYNNLIINNFNFDGLQYNHLYSHKLNNIITLYNQQNNNNNNNKSNHNIKNEDAVEKILNKVSELFSIKRENINLDFSVSELGGDSLMGIQLKQYIDREIKRNLFSIQELQKSSFNQIIKKLNK